MFWKKPKIEVFVRHCHFSEVSQHKSRIRGFSRQKCHDNLLATLDTDLVNVTFLLDTFHPTKTPHFVTTQTKYRVISFKGGTETASFLTLLDYVVSLKLKPETLIYFLEDDYLHRPNWASILLEGFSIAGISYMTLYDHRDKYFLPAYDTLESKLFYTPSCHWRTTPSTTNTYAMRYQTLLDDLPIHKQFSENRRITADHDKFIELGRRGATLISPLPGFSTHCDEKETSPCTDWEKMLNLKPLEAIC
jgi:hypothetical protein